MHVQEKGNWKLNSYIPNNNTCVRGCDNTEATVS